MNKFIEGFRRSRAIPAMAIPVVTALIQAAVVSVAGAAPESDIFHPSTALQPFWRFVDPAGDCALNLTGSTADNSISGGSSHDLWTGDRTPRSASFSLQPGEPQVITETGFVAPGDAGSANSEPAKTAAWAPEHPCLNIPNTI